ncbi:flagellar motor switch protein FliM [Cognatishimia sp. SS12]|uniref:flagellar motor switch protein FliM n=1 Tax=Cognatishimia sp. SS12 TaxID=2979465 RepID=UPI00232B1B4E|nr:FliM/FliN family flagellar motor switch protein [Cognatishimia sp. SS12]
MTPEEIKAQSGNLIDEIIRMSDFSFERLPMLDIIGERLADSLSVVMPEVTGVLCEASLNQLDYLPMAQAAEGLNMPALLGIVAAQNLDGEILIAMDATFALTAMELMLGGSAKGEMVRQSDEFTAIERGFGHRIGDVVTGELRRCLAMVGDIDLELDRVEIDPDSASVTQPANLCVRMRIAIVLAGRTGSIDVVIPYDALEPIRPKLGKIHFGEPSEDGNPWKEQLGGQIERSTVELEAVLTEVKVPIKSVMNWKPGETINLWIDEDHEATVVCAETEMFKAVMGKRTNGNTAIRITEQIEAEEEAENGRDPY